MNLVRRRFLKGMGCSLGLPWVAPGALVGALFETGCGLRRGEAVRRPAPVTSFITEDKDFFLVTPHLAESDSTERPPVPPTADGNIALVGPDGAKKCLALDQLSATSRQIFRTIECIANPVGGPVINNAKWTVAPLAPVIAGILPIKPLSPEVGKRLAVVFTGRDGYRSVIPLSITLSDQSFIAYEINDKPLSPERGFPARLLLPGLYGGEQVRWLNQIELTDNPGGGYWEGSGWDRLSPVKIMSRIDAPRDYSIVDPGAPQLRGMAFAGAEAVARVEVSVNNGRDWLNTNLLTAPAPNVWTLWEFPGGLKSGRYTAMCRAIDARGTMQTRTVATPKPAGATGYHTINFAVT